MDQLRKIIEEKKRKGEEKKPRYGMRKLSVGVVSCMLGYFLFFAAPMVANAAEIEPEDANIIQMQSVEDTEGISDNQEVTEDVQISNSLETVDMNSDVDDTDSAEIKEEGNLEETKQEVAEEESLTTAEEAESESLTTAEEAESESLTTAEAVESESLTTAEAVENEESETFTLTYPSEKIWVADPSNLTAEEQAAVEQAVRGANPNLPADATLTVAKDGTVTIVLKNGQIFTIGQETVIQQARPVSFGSVGNKAVGTRTMLMKAEEAAGIEAPIALFATGGIGDKESSGNIDSENLGYAPNAKYSFQDLKFDPEQLDTENAGSQIKFEVYGKHNIAASSDNWKINLQIDERIAQYVTKIEVEPKRLIESNPRPTRRVFTRKSDTIGRRTNVWEVNYIRESAGLFAGAETTDTQTAHNGIIYLEKPLNEILAEIGDDKLTSDRLFYRIYLTSVQDGGAIVPGISSTGFFGIKGLDHPVENVESTGNETWFKHAAVEGRYTKHEKIKNPDGTINENGAIVVDHKISKNANFAYKDAKNTPWTLEYGVDPRLVKYIDGIELYYMSGASNVTPDYSMGSDRNYKVRNLALERTEGHAKYGYGEITDNTFTDIVDIHGGSPRPITIRYVYKLNKPMDEILAELKEEAGVEAGNSFGEDFIFSAWITDSTEDALITNTYGTGYYRIQDIDGDGKLDEEEANNEQSPYIGIPTITAPYEGDNKVKATVHLNENAGKGNQAQLIDKEGNVIATIDNVNAEENGVPKTIEKELEFTVTDSSKLGKARDELIVRIIPSDPRYTKGEEAKATVKEAPKAVKDPITVVREKDLTQDTALAESGIANADRMPAGTTYRWKTAPDTSKAGNTTGVVLVTVPDREEAFEVKVPLEVLSSDADKYAPQVTPITKDYGTPTTEDEVKGAVTVPGYPADADKKPEITLDDVTQLPNGNIAGDHTVDVTVIYPDGSEDKVQVTVTVKEQKENEKYTPEFNQIEKGYGEATTEDDIKGALKGDTVPENTEVSVKNPDQLPDGMTEGTFDVDVTVTYPDGTNENAKVKVVVTDDRTNAEKYTPEFNQIEKGYGEATTEQEIEDALKEDSVPEGTIVSVKDPDQLPDGKQAGTFDVGVTVTYPDGTSEDAKVKVVVTDNFLVVTKTPPAQIEGQEVAEHTSVITANSGFTVKGVHDEGLDSGLSIDKDGNLIGTPNLNWGDKNSPTYEEQTVTLHAIVTSETGSEKSVTIPVVVQRDTDGDGEPDITDPDDDGDGITDVEEIEKGSDPKDPNSIPQIDLIVPPTVGDLGDQTVVEGTAITPVTPEASEGSNVTVEGLTDGLTFENGTIQGTPEVTWNGAEESRDITVTVKAEKDGATTSKSFEITVQRDTDGDGEPDITDPDDDGDGITDVEEIEKGSDPKDPNSIPQMNTKPGKPDKTPEAKPESPKNNVVGNKANISHKNATTSTPKTGDFSNVSGYAGLAALAGGLLVLLGIKKRKEEEEASEE